MVTEPTMELDPGLKSNATAYDVVRGKGFFEKMYNISFGPYQVSDAASGWTKTGSQGLSWRNFAGGHNFTLAQTETSVEHSYKFTAGNQTPWDATCALLAKSSGIKLKAGQDISQSTSGYICQFTREGSSPWGLSILQVKDSLELQVEMASEKERFTAYSDRGGESGSGSSGFQIAFTQNSGFTWEQGNKKIGAVSVKDTAQKIWLDNRNSNATNDILAMASAGLLIYHMKIKPTLD